jgi:hypothetical protein
MFRIVTLTTEPVAVLWELLLLPYPLLLLFLLLLFLWLPLGPLLLVVIAAVAGPVDSVLFAARLLLLLQTPLCLAAVPVAAFAPPPAQQARTLHRKSVQVADTFQRNLIQRNLNLKPMRGNQRS